jgi:transcription elongation factor Elf1
MKINQKSCPCCGKKSLVPVFKYRDEEINIITTCSNCLSSTSFSALESFFSWQESIEKSYNDWCEEIARTEEAREEARNGRI